MKRLNSKSGKNRYGLQTILLSFFLAFAAYVVFFHTETITEKTTEYSLNTINSLYGNDIDIWSKEYDLPPAYLKALIMLETSGRKKIPSRFEEHVYDQLVAVKENRRKKYEHVNRRKLKDATDEALRNLASSWGPFQIMGYKCLELEITVSDLRGEKAIEHGTRWIKNNYGKMLKNKQFKDAFHYHNTGKRFPKSGNPFTHDPDYVINGLKYMEYFRSNPSD